MVPAVGAFERGTKNIIQQHIDFVYVTRAHEDRVDVTQIVMQSAERRTSEGSLGIKPKIDTDR